MVGAYAADSSVTTSTLSSGKTFVLRVGMLRIVFLALFILCASLQALAETTPPSRPAAFDVPGVLLIKLKPGKGGELLKNLGQRDGFELEENELLSKIGIYKIKISDSRLRGGLNERNYASSLQFTYPEIIDFAEQDVAVPLGPTTNETFNVDDHANSAHEIPMNSILTPNDPRFPEQWNLQQIYAPAGWSITSGSTELKIALIDSGIHGPHPDLASKILPGIDLVNNTDLCNHHATSVAGIMAASTNNGLGIAGVNWGAKIIPIKVTYFNASAGYCFGNYSTIAQGLVWAADNGARVANLSFDGMANADSLDNAAAYFMQRGGVVVAPAVRYLDNTDDPYIVNVNNLTPSGEPFGLPIGDHIDLSTPAYNLLTTVYPDVYSEKCCLSFAAPQVAGAAGLIMSVNPALTPQQVVQILKNSAQDLGPPGHDNLYGTGRLNIEAALLSAQQTGALTISASPPQASYVDSLEDRDATSGALLGTKDISITFSAPVTNVGGPR